MQVDLRKFPCLLPLTPFYAQVWNWLFFQDALVCFGGKMVL